MKMGEGLRTSLRSIRKRPVESLLLILGVALGIGATAAGVSMVSLSNRQSRELLSSVQYREVLVSSRESSEDMDLPAVVQGDEEVFLTTADLRAQAELPDIQYAYTATRMELRLGSFQFGGPGGEGPPVREATAEGSGEAGGATAAGAAAAGVGATSAVAAGDASAPRSAQGTTAVDTPTASGSGASTTPGDAPAQRTAGDPFSEPAPVVDGPQPVPSEIPGYRVTPEFFDAYSLYALTGSVFTLADMDSGARLMVLGSELAETLFEDGESLGRELVAQRELYTITGILEPTGTDLDAMAFVPDTLLDGVPAPELARRFFNTTLHFAVYEPERLDEAKAQLTEWFEQNYGAGLVSVSIPREQAEAARDRNTRLVTVILFLAVAGLLIASVNVSNILLGRAMRKRKTVGVLKALGATTRDVFGLFFVEALVIGAGGAVVGAGLSLLVSRIMNASVSGGAFAAGMLFLGILGAWAVTTALTVIPALQASRIPAAEALRYE